jgi:L-seryl-tRNA(Ser) seleniumtransferase
VSKEEIVGLLVALERFVALDHVGEQARQEKTIATICARLLGVPHVEARVVSAAETGRDPLLELHLDEAGLGLSAFQLSLVLQHGDPPIHLGERRAADGILTVNPAGLRDGDDAIVAARLLAACEGNG